MPSAGDAMAQPLSINFPINFITWSTAIVSMVEEPFSGPGSMNAEGIIWYKASDHLSSATFSCLLKVLRAKSDASGVSGTLSNFSSNHWAKSGCENSLTQGNSTRNVSNASRASGSWQALRISGILDILVVAKYFQYKTTKPRRNAGVDFFCKVKVSIKIFAKTVLKPRRRSAIGSPLTWHFGIKYWSNIFCILSGCAAGWE